MQKGPEVKSTPIELSEQRNPVFEKAREQLESGIGEIDIRDMVERGEINHEEACELLLSLNERLREENRKLEKEAKTDYLTGLLNRGAFDEKVNGAFEKLRSKQERRSSPSRAILFIMVDITLKPINEKHGHDAGDKALKTTAKALKDCVREDEVGRLGGDEFGVLLEIDLPGKDGNKVVQACEGIKSRLEKAVSGLSFTVEGVEGPIEIPAAIGSSILTKTEDDGKITPDEFKKIADTELGLAKEQQREAA